MESSILLLLRKKAPWALNRQANGRLGLLLAIAGALPPRHPMERADTRASAMHYVNLLTALIASACTLHADASTRGDAVGRRVEAIWRVQSFDFHHSSSVAHSCGALRRKIVHILEAVGADEAPSVSIECGSGLLRTALVHITLASPVTATPESVRLATSFDGRAELTARMRHLALPTPAEVERFPATWRRVSLAPRGSLRLDASDCDLVRGMVRQILPKLAARVERKPVCIDGVTRPIPLEVVALLRDSPETDAPAVR
jgi:hypothetical protein